MITDKIKKILPWGVAAAIFSYLFYIYPPHKIWEALQYVNLTIFIPFAFAYFLFIYTSDIFAITRVLKRFGYKVPMREILPARGATYLLMVLNYGAAQAGFAYYLKKKKGIPIWEALSIFFFIVVIDLYWVLTLAFFGSFFQDYEIQGIPLKTVIWFLTAVAFGVMALNISFWRGGLAKKIGGKKSKFVQWMYQKDLFKIFKEASLADYLKTAVLRTPIHISLIFSSYILIKTFGVDCPFLPILGSFPVVMLVGSVPITPGGLGTSNATMVELLSPHLSGPIFDQGIVSPQELLLAASLLWMFTNYSLKTLLGAICLKKVSKDLPRHPSRVAPELLTPYNPPY